MSTPNRAQIPISFQYTNTDGDLIPIPIATSVLIQNRVTGTPATVYATETGSDIVGFIQTDEGGNIQGWLEQGSYSFSASANLDANPPYAGAELAWEAVCGDRMKDAEANIATLQGNVTDINNTNTAIENSASPIGSVVMYMGTTDPDDGCWKLLRGGTVVQASFPDFAAWAIANGMPSDGTYIYLPDMRQRFPLGKADAGTGSTLRGTGGSLGHTHSVPGLSIPGLSIPVLSVAVGAHHHGLGSGFAQFNTQWANSSYLSVYQGSQVGAFTYYTWGNAQGGYAVASGSVAGTALGGTTDNAGAGGSTGGSTTGGGTTGGGTTGGADPSFISVNFIIRVK